MNDKYLIKFIPELTVLMLGLILIYCFHLNLFLFRLINPVSKFTGSFLWANITILGDALVASVIVFLFIKKKPELVWTALIAALVSTLLVQTIKPFLDFTRPPAILDRASIQIIGPAYSRHSFPSGHSTSIFTVIGVLMIHNKYFWQRSALFFFACLVAISRIVVGVHWPGDVIAGAVIGLAGVAVGYIIVRILRLRAYRPAQIIFGGLFLIATLILLTTHNAHYKQALWFQRIIAAYVLIAGGVDYARLFLIKRALPDQTIAGD